jgi:hypothetical protein
MTLHETDTGWRDDGVPAPPGRPPGTEPGTRTEPPRRPPTPGGFSIRPAMVVLGLATLILVVFVTIGIVTSQSPTPVRTTSVPVVVSGSSLKAESAAGLLGPIVTGGEPPTNILNAVFVPAGSVRESHQNTSAGSGQFDAQVSFRADATQAEVLSFFAAVMKQQGWQVFDQGPAANATNTLEVLGKLAGSDGYYWEMGATIPPTTFGKGAPPTGATPFTVRLFQEDDESS